MASDRTVTTISDIPYRDLTTDKASFVIRTTSVGDYLQRVGIYDPTTKILRAIDEVRSEFQRKAIAIARNPIKRKMFRDLLCGATVPPVVLADDADREAFTIIDGLQRSHVQQLAVITLMSRENNKIEASGKESEFIANDIETIEKSGKKVISLKEFLEQPITYQLWRDLTHDEMVRLFMVLNVGQQKIAPRHLLEILSDPLKSMFEGWGISAVSLVDEQTKKEQAKDGKQKKVKVYEDGAYRFENLIDGLVGYISTDPQIKTVRVVQAKTHDIVPDLDNAIHTLGTNECKADFLWVLNDLHNICKDAYKEHRVWSSSIVANTTRFVPLMAALGKARKNSKNSEALEGRKLDLLRHCKETSHGHDPLCFLSTSGSNSLESIFDRVKSNMARRERAIFYNAWCQYFRIGLEDDKCPIDWSHGASHVGLEDAAN
jgi:hypothetical protein